MPRVREVVLDAQTGLPEVRVSRSVEGQLTFRVHSVLEAGMSIFVPINDALLRSIQQDFADDDDVSHADQIAAVSKRYAASLANAEADHQQRLIDLEAENAALTSVLEEERSRHAEEREALQAQITALRAPKSPPKAKRSDQHAAPAA